MKQEVIQTNFKDSVSAARDLCSKLKQNPSRYSAIIFFASSSYDFQTLSQELYKAFPNAEVIGTTTAGEITSEGFSTNTVVLNALYDTSSRFKGILVDDADKFPIIFKKDIEKAANDAGITLSSATAGRDAFVISLICGLLNAEEGLLSLLYTLIKDPNFLVAGGSAGDDLAFKETFVSYNGQCTSRGGVFLFVKTNSPFEIYKENIFQRSGKSVLLTKVNPATREVLAIDGKNPRKRYAEQLGISESNVDNAILEHPFGRVFGDNIFIASLVKFDSQGKLDMYARVLQGSEQEILEPMDLAAITENSCREVLEKIPNPGCIILFNCILRTLGFQKKNQTQTVTNIWNKYFPVYSGFSTYGEQYGHINSNQTLVALVIGD